MLNLKVERRYQAVVLIHECIDLYEEIVRRSILEGETEESRRAAHRISRIESDLNGEVEGGREIYNPFLRVLAYHVSQIGEMSQEAILESSDWACRSLKERLITPSSSQVDEAA